MSALLPHAIIIAQQGIVHEMALDAVAAHGIRNGDLVLDVSGEWRPAAEFTVLQPFLLVPPKRRPLAVIAKGAAIVGGGALAAYGLCRVVSS